MRARHLPPNYRIAVIGAGAIGSYYGGKLAYCERDVHFLIRSGYDEITGRGIRIRGRGREAGFHLAKIQAHRTTESIGPCDLVIIALKTTNNDALLDLVPPLLHEKTALLTLQNGLGNEEFLAQHFGAGRVMGALCFICLNRTAPGVIDQFDRGYLRLGELGSFPKARTYNLVHEFKRCGIVCSAVKNLARERWRKLVWNIPFNGLTIVAGGVTTVEILANDSWRLEALALMKEVIAAANALGHRLPAAIASQQMKRTETMGEYKPSTLLDFQAGRPFELEAIWGEPLRRGKTAGAQLPRLADLYEQLKAMKK